MQLQVEAKRTAKGAITGIIRTSPDVQLGSTERACVAHGRTHWLETVEGAVDDLVLVRDISNTGQHHCYVTTLGGWHVLDALAHHSCVCEDPEEAINEAWLIVLDHQLERAEHQMTHPERYPVRYQGGHLSVDVLYLMRERSLSPEQKEAARKHFRSCTTCHEYARRLVQAASFAAGMLRIHAH